MEENKLVMVFKNTLGNSFSLTVDDPKDNLEANFQAIVANLGFPIAISLYLLVRIEGKLQALTDSINELSHNITKMG